MSADDDELGKLVEADEGMLLLVAELATLWSKLWLDEDDNVPLLNRSGGCVI